MAGGLKEAICLARIARACAVLRCANAGMRRLWSRAVRSYSGLGGISGCVPPHSVVRRDPFEIDPLRALYDCGLMSELVVSVIERPLELGQGGEPISLSPFLSFAQLLGLSECDTLVLD